MRRGISPAILLVVSIVASIASPHAAVAAENQPAAAFAQVGPFSGRFSGAIVGHYVSPRMSIEVALKPRNQAALDDLLARLYDPASPEYHHWLQRGRFDASFSPSRETIDAVDRYLESRGLAVQRSRSPFLVRAIGSSTAVESAFRTRLAWLRAPDGSTGVSNVSPAQLPAQLASSVIAVVGLERHQPARLQRRTLLHRVSGHANPFTPSCEAPYPTAEELFAYVNGGIGYPSGYGGGPSCSGLTPGQTNALYGAPPPAPNVQGSGVHLAVIEESGYTASDFSTWWQQFYPTDTMPAVTEEDVDGGPLNPQCPSGDSCNDFGYLFDLQVDADVEMLLGTSPAAAGVNIYDYPNDATGQTQLDTFAQIASDDTADVIDTEDENDEITAGCEMQNVSQAGAENTYFKAMAAQGQSVFAATGNFGAFACLGNEGPYNPITPDEIGVTDPASNPHVTAVGGTSFESFDPKLQPDPRRPKDAESVWNTDDLCNESTDEGDWPGAYWCWFYGAGGGGDSALWGAPDIQKGPGVINAYSQYGNGTTQCAFAPSGHLCREVPDVSANADIFTPYAEYCTGTDPTSLCGYFSEYEPSPGWFGGYGTGWASALWAGIIADRDSYVGGRTGEAAALFYAIIKNGHLSTYFHNITGAGQTVNNNGLFPTEAGYNQATGLGSPKMSELITNTP